MAFEYSDEIKNRLKSLGILSYEIKVYIQDSNGVYVDFSDREELDGTNRLMSIGSITHASEGKTATGSFYTTVGDIVMDNNDNFWDEPITGLKTVTGATASFDVTKGGHMSVFQRNKLKVAMRLQMENGNFVETPLGVFLVDEIIFNQNTVSIKTVGLAKPLMEQSAESVKDGISWHTNKPIKFLVEELLKLEYGQLKGSAANNRYRVPTSYIIPDEIPIATANNDRTSSSFGRPPEWDGDVWRNDGLTTRALLWSYSTLGSDQSGNDKDTLYMGCDDELWRYSPGTDTYTSIDTSTITTTYKIRKLWYNSNDYYVYGFATEDPQTADRTVGGVIFRITSASGTIDIRKAEGDGNGTDKIFLGDFAIRTGDNDEAGAPNNQAFIGDDIDSTDMYGENLIIAFPQLVRSMTDNIYRFYKSDANDGDADASNYVEKETAIQEGYWATHSGNVSNTDNVDARFSFGSPPFILFSENSGTSGKILWWEYGSATYKLNSYDIDTDAVTENVLTLGSGTFHPLCGVADPATDDIYFAMYVPEETADLYHGARILYYKYEVDADSATNFFNDPAVPGANTYGIPIEMIWVTDPPVANYNLYMVMLDDHFDDATSPQAKYAIMRKKVTDNTVPTSIATRPWQPKGLVLGTAADSGGTSGNIYFVNCGPGSLAKLKVDDSEIVPLDFGWPIVDGETNIASNLVIDSDTRSGADSNVLYGVSAPYYPAETQDPEDPPIGKYYLWKFDTEYSGRIELADFAGMSVWDALSDFAQLANYVIGFTSEGDFFFVPRASSTSAADFTLTTDPDDNTIINIQKDLGYKEIYNYCSITPSKSVVQEPKSEFIIKQRPDNTPLDSRYAVDQRDTLKKNVRLACTRDGDIEDSNALFKWLTYTFPIETIITQAYTTSDTTIYLASVFGGASETNGIHVDDYIVVIDPDNNQEVVSRITAVSTSNNSITIGSTDAGNMPNLVAETACTILKQHKISSAATTTATRYTKWSDEGITYVPTGINNNYQTLATTEDLAVQGIVRFGTSGQYARIASINSTSHIIYLKDIDQYTNTPNLSINVSNNDVVYSWYSPLASSGSDTDYQEIGGTQVWAKWQTKSNGNDTFKQGDTFFIECPGKKLEKEEESRQVFVNSNSVSKYGRREYPSIDNKFIDRKVARDFSRKVINEWAEPKFVVKAQTILLPYINFVNTSKNHMRINVQDHRLFKIRKNNTEECLIRKITHDPMNFTSVFELKGRLNY